MCGLMTTGTPDVYPGLCASVASTEVHGRVENRQVKLEKFLAVVERPAFRMAVIAVKNPDDALDIVQDAMIKLVEKYAARPEPEWRPLFFTILQSKITDHHRRRTLTHRIFGFRDSAGGSDEGDTLDYVDSTAGPEDKLLESLTIERLEDALEALSIRQQQVFMLRTWQGFSVAETARILKLSEGSVKTHLSRATAALLQALQAEDNHAG